MAVSTTQSIWRSGGGDQTRTAYCGSGGMYATFYIPNSSSATANVVTSSLANAQPVVLPAGAVVTSITITNGAGGNAAANIGFTPLVQVGPGQTTTLGTNVTGAFVSAGNVAARTVFTVSATAGASLGNVANATNLVVVTSAIGVAGAAGGAVSGLIHYYVADPYSGQQNV